MVGRFAVDADPVTEAPQPKQNSAAAVTAAPTARVALTRLPTPQREAARRGGVLTVRPEWLAPSAECTAAAPGSHDERHTASDRSAGLHYCVPGTYSMARPGLEPGTPRFSVVYVIFGFTLICREKASFGRPLLLPIITGVSGPFLIEKGRRTGLSRLFDFSNGHPMCHPLLSGAQIRTDRLSQDTPRASGMPRRGSRRHADHRQARELGRPARLLRAAACCSPSPAPHPGQRSNPRPCARLPQNPPTR
jgi:hypothetical protein